MDLDNPFFGLDSSIFGSIVRGTRAARTDRRGFPSRGQKQNSGGSGGAGGGAGSSGSGSSGDGAGEGEGDDGDDDGDGGSKGKDSNVPRTELNRVVGQRDRYKHAMANLAEELGIEVEWENDDDNPGKKRAKFKGLDALKKKREGADGADGKKGGREQELEKLHTEKVTKLTSKHQRRENALTSIVADLAVVAPLRAALAAEGAYDDPEGKGEYNDLVELLRKSVRAEIEHPDDDEDENAKAVLKLAVIGPDGEPLSDGNGKRKTIQQFVKEYLDKRPNLRKAEFRRGSGAGGHGGSGGAGGRTGTVKDAATQAVAALFGKQPTK